MLTSIRNRLMTTAMAMTPFLLSACDNSNPNNGPNHFEIVVLPALIYTAFLADNWLRKRSAPQAPAAV